MCGICGYLSNKEIQKNEFEKMNDSMYHRGPDDAGIYQVKIGESALGLAQRRLSILDLSHKGHQPMFDEQKRCAVVFNGEIYNFRQIRDDLKKRGYFFFSDCDTEVVLKAYLEYKEDFLRHLNGMFAIAIYDFEKNRLLLARDRLGKKPLYYYQNENEFVFASELKPIMLYPYFQKEIRTDIIARYLVRSSIIPPDTIFLNTYKLRQGEYLIYQNGKITKKEYWKLLDEWRMGVQNQEEDYAVCKKEIKKLLYDAVEKRLIADVPIGAFLSGGIDSTLVSAVANEIKTGGIDTFSIGFEDERYDESPYAKVTANYLGTNHHEMVMTEKQLLEVLDDLPLYYDEPFADSSQLPSMLVAGFAKEKITAALSGDGGDEFFCGYTAYDELAKMQKLEPFLNIIRACTNKESVEKLISDDRVCALLNNRDKRYKIQILPAMREQVAMGLLKDKQVSAKYDQESMILAEDWKEKGMLLDMMTYLPDEILTKMDRASMRYSLEVRCPILDYRILEYSFRIPMKYKYRKQEKKYLLKDILYDYIPREMMERKKQGFAVPISKWLRGCLRKKLMCYADRAILERQEIFVPEKIQELIECAEKSDRYLYQSILWGFFVFQMWYQEYIEDLWN